jgi:glycosyltransferase involved in cell wall biosynthesis
VLNQRRISAFFPCFNDAGTIASMVMEALVVLRDLAVEYEVIVIENGSTDYAWDVLDELERLYGDWGVDNLDRGRVRIIRFAEALDYGGALRAGFAACRYELIFYTDGDGQYDPRELALLLPALKPGIDVVNGYKISRSDPIGRVIIGRLYHWAMKLLFGFKLRDVDCDFRLIRRTAMDRITLTSDSGMICLELVKKLQDAGCRFAEVPVHHYHRAYGRSQFFNFPRIWRTVLNILSFWWQLRIRRLPTGQTSVATPDQPRSGAR